MKVNKMAMILGVLLAGSLSMGQGRALAAEAPAAIAAAATGQPAASGAVSKELPVAPVKT